MKNNHQSEVNGNNSSSDYAYIKQQTFHNRPHVCITTTGESIPVMIYLIVSNLTV